MNIFISYSHDSPQHQERVLALADRLRADGIDATIDQYQSAPPEGWQLWMEKQIRDARFVLLICTETYYRRVMKEEAAGKGRGVMWESTIINQHLYNSGVMNERFIPVVFEQEDRQYIPTPLQPTTDYDVGTDEGYEKLYRRLTDQPETPAPVLGKRRALPPRPRPIPESSTQPRPQPTSNLVHPYPMQANFTGRVSERRELTAWLADDTRPIYALVAMGGMGKSALAWHWIKNDVLSTAQPAAFTGDGVMWWSFYEGESSFAKFIDDALKYVGNQPIDTTLLPTTYDRAQELRQLLQTKRVLFILDGFERQLRAYASLDAAYKSADSAPQSRDARACVDPIAARWLRDIAAVTTRAKVLLTTRLPVSDLEDRAGAALAGVHNRDLKELPRDDAVKFMHGQGVTKGLDTEIAKVCTEYGNHPLSLRLLSGLIARDARMPGDIAATPRHDVHEDLIQRQHHILEQSYNALPKRERALLSRIAAFRNPMTYDALLIFNTFGDEAKFEASLDNLRVRGLLQRDMAHNRYDLHPIVRQYAYDRLTGKIRTHNHLRDYFAKIPLPDNNALQSIEDLASVIELYHHTVCARRYDEALELFYRRLHRLLQYRFGAYQTQIELLRALFPDGEGHLPRVKDVNAQAWTLAALAIPYGSFGQHRHAVLLRKQQIAIRERQGDKKNLANGLDSIGTHQIILGELAEAAQNLRRDIELTQEIEDEFRKAIGYQHLGLLLTYCGLFDEAEAAHQHAIELARKLQNNQLECMVRAYSAIRALSVRNYATAIAEARSARALAELDFPGIGKIELDIIRAEWLLGAALVMEEKDLNAAATHLTNALTRCRRINMVDYEPDILIAWARWYRARGNEQEAQGYAEEALTIADRCEFRLKQAEVHNFFARLALDAGNREVARKHAEVAKERAWCDGPPHCYKVALDEAEWMLGELGAGELEGSES
jgi:tetratricopeptide (TPR) repeat protein